jgi:uncharacterized protein (DUF433 family)
MTAATGYAHVDLEPDGWPMIAGTRVSVARVAADYTEHAIPIEDIPRLYGGLTLAQVLGALTYYFDHKDMVDGMIGARRTETADGREIWSASQEQLCTKLASGESTP